MGAIKIISGLDWGKRVMVFYRENWNYWINAGEMFRVKAFLEDRCPYLFQDKDVVPQAIGIRVPAGVERDKFTLWNGNPGMKHIFTVVVYKLKHDGWNKFNDQTLAEYIAELDRYSDADKRYEWIFLGE